MPPLSPLLFPTLVGKRVYLNNPNPNGYPRYAGTVRGHWEPFRGSSVYRSWADVDWDTKGHPCTNPIEIKHLRLVDEVFDFTTGRCAPVGVNSALLPRVAADEFRCAACGSVFKKAWSDEEARAEQNNNDWGALAPEDCSIICDDCYRTMQSAIATGALPRW